jgi:hypothetical protein
MIIDIKDVTVRIKVSWSSIINKRIKGLDFGKL